MGLLIDDEVLGWKETREHTAFVKSHAILQLLHVWDTERERRDDPPLWGDEIEYFLIRLDEEEKTAKVSLRQKEVRVALDEVCSENDPNAPEYAGEFTRFMVESNPGSPYNTSFSSLLTVEPDMRRRRDLIWNQLDEYEAILTLSSFPRFGAESFTHPPVDCSKATLTRSLFVPDEVIGDHGRYEVIAVHIRERRGSKPTANIPIFFDKYTPQPFIDPTIPRERYKYPEDDDVRIGAALTGHIYLDTALLGEGGCCLQVNIQLKDMHEARRIYDALLPITPIMLALTASSPAWRGYLSELDCRTFAASRLVDDRRPDEHSQIRKSRCDIGDMYIWIDPRNKPEYSDLPLSWNEDAYSSFKAHGQYRQQLCQFLATLFIRDPLLVFANNLHPNGPDDVRHFENINSSVWQTMRLKPPVPKSKLGWRIEFRSMEASVTDFESAAYSIFVVEENMKIAECRDAARQGLFHFRKHIFDGLEEKSASIADQYEFMTIDEIFNGKKDDCGYTGLIQIVRDYIAQSSDEDSYVDFVSEKASGSLPTTATWIRDFIRSHPAYKFDSVYQY
ncbi:gamma glutamylcysteine synthetase [Cyathus striatus]|nr:gamma glutamylcysteine synthetase [Cyathus striatus]